MEGRDGEGIERMEGVLEQRLELARGAALGEGQEHRPVVEQHLAPLPVREAQGEGDERAEPESEALAGERRLGVGHGRRRVGDQPESAMEARCGLEWEPGDPPIPSAPPPTTTA